MAIGVNKYEILSPDQANPLGYGLRQGLAMRLAAAQAKEQEEKNPFVGRQAEANLESTLGKNIYQQLVNQYTPEDYQTQFASRRASTAASQTGNELNKLKLQYPGLGEGGIVGQLAFAAFQSDHPEIAQKIQGAMGGGQGQEASLVDGLSNQLGGGQQGQQQPQPGQPQQAQQQQSDPNSPLGMLMRSMNADIGGKESLAQYRGAGGAGGGVSAKQQMLLQSQIQKDNPGFSPEQAFDAAGQLVQGNQTLSDGTPFNASGLTRLSAAKSVMQGTTSQLTTRGVKSSQAEAEIPVFDEAINKGLSSYADRVGGVSSQQVRDMASPNDDAAQKRLGEFAAAQQLGMDKAGLTLTMAGIEAGVTTVGEAMKLASQDMKNSKFIQTEKARKAAVDAYGKALKDGLKARKSVGVLESGLTGSPQRQRNNQSNDDFSNMSDDELRKLANG